MQILKSCVILRTVVKPALAPFVGISCNAFSIIFITYYVVSSYTQKEAHMKKEAISVADLILRTLAQATAPLTKETKPLLAYEGLSPIALAAATQAVEKQSDVKLHYWS